MASGADDHGFFAFGAKRRDARRCGMRAEINHNVASINHQLEVVSLVNLAHDLQLWIVRRASEQRPAHAPFGTGDDDFAHVISPARNVSSFHEVVGDFLRSSALAGAGIPLRSVPLSPTQLS